MSERDIEYQKYLLELKNLIPKEEYEEILSQLYCELDNDFLGFIDIYKPLSELIPKDYIVIDFGCNLAAQSYFFKEHKQYIGVDLVEIKRFQPKNAVHYTKSIQDFIHNDFKKIADNIYQYCAICSYVPDREATELVRKTFPNVFCFYPSGLKRPKTISTKKLSKNKNKS